MSYPLVISGKNAQLYVCDTAPTNPLGFASITALNSGSETFTPLNFDTFELTEKVDSSKYASSLTSGYMRNTTGIYEADGSFDVLLAADGVLAASGSIGVGIDHWVDFAVQTKTNNTTPPTGTTGIPGAVQIAGTMHINQIGNPIATADGKIKIKVTFSIEGQWFKA